MADDLDLLDDIFGDAPAKNARVVGKFRPKPKFQPQRKVLAKSSVASSQAVQTVHSSLHDLSGPIETANLLEHSSDVLPNDNTEQACLTIDSAPCESTQPIKNAESLEYGSNAVPNDKADLHGIAGKSIEENADILIRSEALANFSPRTNTEHAVAPSEAVALDAPTTENIGRRLETQVLQSEPLQPDYAEKASIPTFQHDAVDISSPGFTHILPNESTSELPLNEESMNIREVAQLDSCTHMGGLHDFPAKLASRRAKTGNSKTDAASDHYHQQQKASTSSQENEAIRSLRPRKGKTNFRELIDEDGDESSAAGELSEERHLSCAVDEENINNEQPQVENESQKKILKRKSKKTENDKEKPPRKSKKAKEASEQEIHAKKKFSHSTRRRRVDKDLLNIPEDEFDPSVVSLRDLILLAEHRERETKAEQPAAGAPATQKSTGENNDGEGSPIADDTAEYFNYQSRMEKTPRVRWSKEDTELFYQAVQQFGTDFSMIAQLFPGRSREQIRNKYKKEERQHPLMLRDALTNRCKDLSYFEKVIENLNKIRAKEDQNADEDDLEDGAPEADDGEAKDDHVEEGENGDNEDVANDSTEVQSPPLKGEGEEEEEEEEDPWSHYTSEI